MTLKERFRNKYRLQVREKDHQPMVMAWLKAHEAGLIEEWKSWQR